MQISIISSREMLLKSESLFKLPIDNAVSGSQISLGKWNETLTVCSLLVKGFNIETKKN